MITGNTLKRLNSGITLGQTDAEPETKNRPPKIDQPTHAQTSQSDLYPNTHRSEEWLLAHQTTDQWRNNFHTKKNNTTRLAEQQLIEDNGMQRTKISSIRLHWSSNHGVVFV